MIGVGCVGEGKNTWHIAIHLYLEREKITSNPFKVVLLLLSIGLKFLGLVVGNPKTLDTKIGAKAIDDNHCPSCICH